MKDEKELIVRSTMGQLEEFKESFIWKDIEDELYQLAKKALIEYDLVGEPIAQDDGFKATPTTAETLIHLGEIKGRRKAVAYFLDIPNILMQTKELEDQEDDSECK